MRKPCGDKQDTNKGAWSKQEDQKLMDYISRHGEGSWRTLPQAAGLLRCGKSCRLRWINYLRPDLKRGNFGEDEEDLIIKLHALLGNRWSLIAGRLPGRTDNEVKNYWNSHLRRKLTSMRIDPNNHRSNQKTFRSNNAHLPIDDVALISGGSTHANQSVKISIENNDLQEVLEGASCLEDSESCGLPDLNLDPTPNTATTTYLTHNVNDQEDHKKRNKFGCSRDQSELIAPSTTLLLFR